MQISGAFVYQPPAVDSPLAGFAIVLNVLNDDGTPMFPEFGDLPPGTLFAYVVLSYPQTQTVWPVLLTASSNGFGPVFANGVFPDEGYPPPGWMPAAMVVDINGWPSIVITAAAPAVPDSGIEKPLRWPRGREAADGQQGSQPL